MTSLGNPNMTYADLERLLEVYGSDRTRWPVEARASAGQLVARDAPARRLLAEAEALDRVLDRAPLPSLAREASLAERIAAAAQRSPRIVSLAEAGKGAARASGHGGGAPGIKLPGDTTGRVVLLPRSPRLLANRLGGAASLLAASLLLGVFIGVSSLPPSLAGPLEQATGLTLSRTPAVIAQVDPLDEDMI
jgi:hypothetical protein